jgi:hypothetical protein
MIELGDSGEKDGRADSHETLPRIVVKRGQLFIQLSRGARFLRASLERGKRWNPACRGLETPRIH